MPLSLQDSDQPYGVGWEGTEELWWLCEHGGCVGFPAAVSDFPPLQKACPRTSR